MTPGPYAWEPHIGAWVALFVIGLAVLGGHRRLERRDGVGTPWPPKQRIALAGAWAAAAVALTWPLADLAAHWSLTALVVQRLILILAVPSLVLIGMPEDLMRRLTRPAPVDTLLDWCRRPVVALVVFTVVGVGSMATPLVEAQGSSPVVRGVMDLVVLAAGFVLWLPVIGSVPGVPRVSPVWRFVYLVVQAVVPAFLSFIYIFARHPLYTTFNRSHLAIGVQPLTDQQLSGFVSKFSMLFVLLGVGRVVLSRAHKLDQALEDEEYDNEPLYWADVQRELERGDRRDAKKAKHGIVHGSPLPPGEPDR